MQRPHPAWAGYFKSSLLQEVNTEPWPDYSDETTDFMGEERFKRRRCMEFLKLTPENRLEVPDWKHQSLSTTGEPYIKYISTSDSSYFPCFLALPIEVRVIIYLYSSSTIPLSTSQHPSSRRRPFAHAGKFGPKLRKSSMPRIPFG